MTAARRPWRRSTPTPATPGFGSVANALGIPGTNPFTGIRIDDLYNQTSNNFALFTHNIFAITDQLKLTVGLRYTREKKTLDANLHGQQSVLRRASPQARSTRCSNCRACIPALPGGIVQRLRQPRPRSKLSGTGVLSYKPTPELLTYASYSRGYKAGGYNLDRAALPRVGGNGPVLPTASARRPAVRPGNQRRVRTRRQV